MTSVLQDATRPTVSVVMIAYNVEPFVAQALDSALMQQVDFPYEIVVGEDRSSDRTRAIVQDYAARHPGRIRQILREANLGMNRNFMETLLAARGEYVALLDADDYWTTPRKLQAQVDYLRAHPACSICFHNALVVYEDQDVASHPFHMAQPTQLISHHVPKAISTLADLAGGNFMQTCSVMFRSGLYGTLPDWYLRMPTFDWPLHVLNAEHGDIGYLDEVMGAYRVHAGGFWSSHMVHYRRRSDVDAMIEAYGIIDRHTGRRYAPLIRTQVQPLLCRAADLLLAEGSPLSAARYAIRGLAAGDPRARRRAAGLLARAMRAALLRRDPA